MKLDIGLSVSNENPFDTAFDVLVVGLPCDMGSSSVATELNDRLGGQLAKLIELGEVSTDLYKTTTLYATDRIKTTVIVTVGLGDKEDQTACSLYRASAAAVKRVSAKQHNRVAVAGFPFGDASKINDAMIVGWLVGSIGQDLYREKKALNPPKQIVFLTDVKLDLKRADAIATGIAMTRSLVNQPPNHIYPASFVDQTLEMLAGMNLQSEVWDETRLKTERCESLLAVGRASDKPSRLLMLRYTGTDAGKHLPPIALVGKGVTFDSGGLSIKPTDGMLTMKCDMAGGATVVGIMFALAKMQVARPVIGLIGLVENMIAGNAFKLGDVLQSRAGKSIEIHNTDAEGRLVLADVLDVACDQSPSHIIDFATLTGACVVALGNDIGGLMSNDDWLQDQIRKTADQTGEYVWPLPMYSFFDEQVQSKVADLKNVGDGRWGGAITAAKFLEQFVRDVPWAHIDLAGPAFADKPKAWCDAGATGYFVQTITQMLEDLGSEKI